MSQQALLRKAFIAVLGYVPEKGKLVITDEQRELVWKEIEKTVDDPAWIRKTGQARTKEEIRAYTIGRNPTDLIQAYVIQRRTTKEIEATPATPVKAKMTPQEILALREAGFSVEDIMKLCA